jgi:diguanylate cyclase (GGDEF)-like protein
MRLLATLWLMLALACNCVAQSRWQQMPADESWDTIEQLLRHAPTQLPWQPVMTDFPNAGMAGGHYWYRLSLPATGTRQALWIRNGVYRTLEVYVVRDGALQWQARGATEETRSLFDDIFLLPGLQPGSVLYLRASSNDVLLLPAHLVSEAELLSLKERQDFVFGLLIGILVVLAAYFSVLFLIVRDRGFLFYVLHSVTVILVVALWHGFDRAPWWPDAMVPSLLMVVSQLVIACLLNLVLWFLRLEHGEGAIARFLRILRIAALLLAVTTPALPAFVAISCCVGIALLMSLGISIALVRHGNFRELSTRLFTLGWLLFLPSTVAMTLYRLGYVGLGMDGEITAYGGWILEMVLQAFALVVRYDMDQRLKLASQQQAIAARERESAARTEALHHEQRALRALQEAEQAQREHAQMLEQRVRERRDELEKIHRELAAISITDALTGLHNRRFFTERFEEEVTRMHRMQAGLSLMLIDVDHFKRINDTHGHLAGDECLRQVALRLKAQLKRPSDVLCRFGGEEFAVLLPDTPLPGALAFANAIREAIAATPLQCGDIEVHATISVGLMVADRNSQLTPDQILQQADIALYQAKNDGRNCVRIVD